MQELPQVTTEKLARVTKLLRTQRTLPAKLETVVALAKRTIPNCHAAGITLVIDGEPTTSAVSDRLVVEVDLVQYQTGEGPVPGRHERVEGHQDRRHRAGHPLFPLRTRSPRLRHQ